MSISKRSFLSLFSSCVVGPLEGGEEKRAVRGEGGGRRVRNTFSDPPRPLLQRLPFRSQPREMDEEEGERPLTRGRERRNGRTVTEITTSAAEKKKAHWSSNTQRTFTLFAVSSSSSHEPALSFNVLGAKAISGHHSWCKRTLAPDLLKSKERVLHRRVSFLFFLLGERSIYPPSP